MKNVKISVIIPVYNAEKFLKTSLESVLKQSYRKIEIILIDDGSTDKSGKICDEYALLDKRIKVIHKKNSGPATSRNIGIKKAKGEYLFFIDADDFLEKDALAFLVSKANQNKAEIIIGDFRNIRDGREQPRADFPFPESILLNKKDLLNYARLYLKKPNKYLLFAVVWGRLFSSVLVKENHIFFKEELQTFEDVAFNFDCLRYAKIVFFCKKILYNHNLYDNYLSATMSIGDKPGKLFGYQQALVEISGFLKKNIPDNEIKKEVGHAYIFLTIIQLIRLCGQLNKSSEKMIFRAVGELAVNSTLQNNLRYYSPAKGDSKILPFLLKLKLVWPVIFVCRQKARQRYKEKGVKA